MKYSLYQIDAFTNRIFGGNPACIVPLQKWLPDAILLKIAQENAVAETAFFIQEENSIHLRWFTPEFEMDLCGHATLAAAHCLKTILHYPKSTIQFNTASGLLTVTCDGDWYHLDFPTRMPVPAELPSIIAKALSHLPNEVFKARDYVLVYDNEAAIRNIMVNRTDFDQINLDPGGVVVTAVGDYSDFVSRFFTPQASILEDPVTGSAHCSLIPFWAKRLQKDQLSAIQLSERIGHLQCEAKGERVQISGQARTYSIGTFEIPETLL